MPLTLDEAKALKRGEVLIYSGPGASIKGSNRWRVNGKVKTWIRMPERIQIPLKHGLYAYGELTEHNLSHFSKES